MVDLRFFRKWTTGWVIFLIVFSIGFAWLNSSNMGDNALSRMALVESLLERHVFFVDGSPYFSRVDAAYLNGHYYTGKQPFLSVYTAALLYPLHLFLKFRSAHEGAILYVAAVFFSSGLFSLILFFFLRRCFLITQLSEEASRWLMPAIFLTSGILPYVGIFVSHIIETALIFGCFYFLIKYRQTRLSQAPIYCGLLAGFSSLFHILIGTLFTVLTALYFLTENLKDFLKYIIFAGLVILLGLGINYAEHGSGVPFDFMFETYLFKDGAWLNYPHNHRITNEQIRRRLDDIGVSARQREKTVAIYTNFRKHVGNIWQFALRRFWISDYLTLNPLFFMGFLSLIFFIFQKDFLWKKEALWVLLGFIMTYFSLLYLRQNPGTFAGNRYLSPLCPLMLFFLGLYLSKKPGSLVLVKVFFWAWLPMLMVFFVFLRKPYPSIHYIYVNVSLTVLSYMFCLFYVLRPKWAYKFIEKLGHFSFSTRWPWVCLVLFWMVFQFYIYRGF